MSEFHELYSHRSSLTLYHRAASRWLQLSFVNFQTELINNDQKIVMFRTEWISSFSTLMEAGRSNLLEACKSCQKKPKLEIKLPLQVFHKHICVKNDSCVKCAVETELLRAKEAAQSKQVP